MSAADLRERLADAVMWVQDLDDVDIADAAVRAVREWLVSDATVERMARAMCGNRFNVDPARLAEFMDSVIGETYLMHARVGLAALADALAPEKGGSDVH